MRVFWVRACMRGCVFVCSRVVLFQLFSRFRPFPVHKPASLIRFASVSQEEGHVLAEAGGAEERGGLATPETIPSFARYQGDCQRCCAKTKLPLSLSPILVLAFGMNADPTVFGQVSTDPPFATHGREAEVYLSLDHPHVAKLGA